MTNHPVSDDPAGGETCVPNPIGYHDGIVNGDTDRNNCPGILDLAQYHSPSGVSIEKRCN